MYERFITPGQDPKTGFLVTRPLLLVIIESKSTVISAFLILANLCTKTI